MFKSNEYADVSEIRHQIKNSLEEFQFRLVLCVMPLKNHISQLRGTTLNSEIKQLNEKLDRLLRLIERAVPPAESEPDFESADAFVWQAETNAFNSVFRVNRVEMALLKGIDHVREILVENTRRFAEGNAANNALLWGARGMGKSSLVKAVHAFTNAQRTKDGLPGLKLVEIHREDIQSLPILLSKIRESEHRFILFCDDLSFDNSDTSYKSLKAALDGGIEGRPEHVIFYATSNRRHLLPRDMIENERSTAISPAEAVEEKVSLSDRFGLWLGFHNCSQDDYLAMVRGYAAHFNIDISDKVLKAQALEWAITRGARSGRVAWQFIQDIAGKNNQPLR